jgi:hypothetical protein
VADNIGGAKAFSSEADTGSRQENASKQQIINAAALWTPRPAFSTA